MSVVLGHFFDRTLPVGKHSEYRPVRQRNGAIWFTKLPCLPTCRLHEVDHDSTETPRDLPNIDEIENEIAVMLVNQAFQLLLHRLTLLKGNDVVTQLDDGAHFRRILLGDTCGRGRRRIHLMYLS